MKLRWRQDQRPVSYRVPSKQWNEISLQAVEMARQMMISIGPAIRERAATWGVVSGV